MRFTYTAEELTACAQALSANVHPGTDWDDLSEGDKGNLERDAETVLMAVGGREA